MSQSIAEPHACDTTLFCIQPREIPYPQNLFLPSVLDNKKGGLKQTAFLAYLLLLETETTVEAINTSAGVNQFLLASVERMALGANFNSDFRLGRMSLDHFATSAGDGAFYVIGMNTVFHSFHLFLVNDSGGHA